MQSFPLPSSLLWTLPFCCFLGTYLFLDYALGVRRVVVPTVVGKDLNEALSTLSPLGLNARLANRMLEPGLPEGTIVSQTPPAGAPCRPGQPVLVVTSYTPTLPRTPEVVGRTVDDAVKELTQGNSKAGVHPVPSSYPQCSCIGQDPPSRAPLERRTVTVYTPSTEPRPIVFPCFMGRELAEVEEFLTRYQIAPEISIEPPARKIAGGGVLTVVNQQPLAGSIIRFCSQLPPCVQLRAQRQTPRDRGV